MRPQPPRTPFRLSDSVHHQLNMYALAASAAGVGVLALAQPSAEARIVYIPAHRVIGENRKYNLALNHNLPPDFVIANNQCLGGVWPCTSSTRAWLTIAGLSSWGSQLSNQVIGAQPWVSALKPGARISKGRAFVRAGYMARQVRGDLGGSCSSAPCTSGPWVNVTNRYLGLKFKIDGKFHYGWARFNVKVVKGQFEIVATLTGYAYETIPNKPIIAGKTKGPDVITVQPASLGHLAQGSAGLAAWRSGK